MTEICYVCGDELEEADLFQVATYADGTILRFKETIDWSAEVEHEFICDVCYLIEEDEDERARTVKGRSDRSREERVE